MATSQNGYSANDRSVITTYHIAGEEVPLRDDACGQLLVEVAEWIHANVESISAGHQADDWGYAERTIRGSSTELSNHASGTALDFNATQHPLGVPGTWSDEQKRKINRFLREECDDTVRWGENYSGRVDGMHFEINADYARVRAALDHLRGTATEEDDMSAREVWRHPISATKGFARKWKAETHLRNQSVMLRELTAAHREILAGLDDVLAESKDDRVTRRAPERREVVRRLDRVLAELEADDTGA